MFHFTRSKTNISRIFKPNSKNNLIFNSSPSFRKQFQQTVHTNALRTTEIKDQQPLVSESQSYFSNNNTTIPKPEYYARYSFNGDSDDLGEILERERKLELSAVEQAREKYLRTAETVTKVKAGAQLPSGKQLILSWHNKILSPIKKLQQEMKSKPEKYTPLITKITADKLGIITIHHILSHSLCGTYPLRDLALGIGQLVQAQINYETMLKIPEVRRGKIDKNAPPFKLNSMALRLLDDPMDWPNDTLLGLGTSLLQILLEKATIPIKTAATIQEIPAFNHVIRMKRTSEIVATPALHQFVKDHNDLIGQLSPKHLPTILPPREWSNFKSGGYHFLSTRIMRTRGSQMQLEVLKDVRIPEVQSALNVLGMTPWQINSRVLDVIEECWENGLSIGDLPPRFGDIEITPPSFDTFSAESIREYSLAAKHNRDLHSLRCDWLLKRKVAKDFRKERFYFPHNIDFRGRAYPIPPHLNHVGSDICRGLLQFDEARPLGKNGLRWLKIHLANLCGKDKLNFDERVEWVDQNMNHIIDSARNPLNGSRWWTEADEPFECLATCFELEEISRCDNPEQFLSRIPVQMDGSCNGLQHYAALGRDEHGAEHVNLLDSEKPMDVYLRVREVVLEHLEEAAKSGDEIATLLLGKVERSTIKQTVMTSVYGVTHVGAREQISRRLKDLDIPESHRFKCSNYLAKLTLKSLGEVFSGAYNIMDWLNNCAQLIAQHGYPVMWVTPLGLPVTQPYRNVNGNTYTVNTIMQRVNLVKNTDLLPVKISKQRSAFPPNYVHSIDATHMFLTANECSKRGLTFAAVHDSFWTHAQDVDEMNHIIRKEFVNLHSQPLLETLLESFQQRYPEIKFKDLPRRGTLDLNEVMDAKYFFD